MTRVAAIALLVLALSVPTFADGMIDHPKPSTPPPTEEGMIDHPSAYDPLTEAVLNVVLTVFSLA